MFLFGGFTAKKKHLCMTIAAELYRYWGYAGKKAAENLERKEKKQKGSDVRRGKVTLLAARQEEGF